MIGNGWDSNGFWGKFSQKVTNTSRILREKTKSIIPIRPSIPSKTFLRALMNNRKTYLIYETILYNFFWSKQKA